MPLLNNDPQLSIFMSGNEVNENAINGTEAGSFEIRGVEGETYTLSLIGNAEGRFELVNGKLLVADGSKLDYEASMFHDITVRVTDSHGVATDMSFAIDVLNVVEAGEKPPVLVVLSGNEVNENASNGTEIGVFESFSPTETYTYALLDSADGRFRLEGNKLIVADGSKLDFEAAETYSVRIRVTDSHGNVSDMEWGVELLDVEEEENFVYGNNKANNLVGGSGKDVISGLGGKDCLVGGAGEDTFRFEQAKLGKHNVDRIVDFSVKDDTIELHAGMFTKLQAGELAQSAFWIGAKAHDANDRIIYDAKKGNLYYDQDGTGAGKQVLFATLSKNLKMSASDFEVIF